MTEKGQALTRVTYTDLEVVNRYVEQARRSRMLGVVEEFAATLPGSRVLDLGCGPGHHAYRFAELGKNVTAVDYSLPMLSAARVFRQVDNPPTFQQGDMRDIGSMFPSDSFDGAWLSDSLFHVTEDEALQVLMGVRNTVVNGGKVYVGLKAGMQGTRLVTDEKYGKPTDREFTFWERPVFQAMAEELGYSVDKIEETVMGTTGGAPTQSLRFFLEVHK